MVATEGRYYYDACGGTIGKNEAMAIKVELRGITLDRFEIYHIRYTRLDSHSTYDAVKIKSYYHYIAGSGLTQYDGCLNPVRWDTATPMTWLAARYHEAHDLIQVFKE